MGVGWSVGLRAVFVVLAVFALPISPAQLCLLLLVGSAGAKPVTLQVKQRPGSVQIQISRAVSCICASFIFFIVYVL